MKICKSCGVTIHEEGKSFCPACEVSARDARDVGLTGDGPASEKVELSLEDDSQRVTVLKLSQSKEKTGPPEEDTDKVKAESEGQPDVPPAAKPAEEDERLSFSESPLSEGFGPPQTPVIPAGKDEPATLSDAIAKSGPKSYLTAEERKALLSDLSAARKGSTGATVKESPAGSPSKPNSKRNDAPLPVREPHSSGG